MKSVWVGSLSLLAVSAALAGPPAARGNAPAEAGSATSVTPIGSRDARQPPRLRDTLRQPFDGRDDGGQPYRLSVEERQRLREQLRGESRGGSSRQP